MGIVVVGSALIDISIKNTNDFRLINKNLKKYISIAYGSKIETKYMELNIGGSGRNVAINLSKLGHRVNFVGKVGCDPFGNQILSDFKKEGVDIRNLKVVKDGKTGFSIVFFAPDGERSIVVYKGRNLDLNAKEIPEQTLRTSQWFIFTSITSKGSLKFLSEALKIAKKNGVKIFANPSMTMIRARKKELLQFIKKSDMVVMNEEEIRELTGTKNVILSMKRLNKLGISLVVTTSGAKGALVYDGTKFYRHRSYRIKIKDTTGCGDSFTAGFLHYILKKKSIPEALEFANANGALQCQKVGSQALPEKEILNFISKQ